MGCDGVRDIAGGCHSSRRDVPSPGCSQVPQRRHSLLWHLLQVEKNPPTGSAAPALHRCESSKLSQDKMLF